MKSMLKASFIADFVDVEDLLRDIKNLERLERSPRLRRFETRALKVMRASAYIVAYNAIERSYRNLFDQIRKDIAAHSPAYFEVDKYWRLDFVAGNLEAKLRDFAKPDRVIDDVDQLFSADGGSIPWLHGNHKRRPNGNVDDKIIKSLIDDLGMKFKAPKSCRDGVELGLVKEKRNSLAHGEETFSQVGSVCTHEDLKRQLTRCKTYVASVLSAFSRYQKSQRYLISKAKKQTPLGRPEIPAAH